MIANITTILFLVSIIATNHTYCMYSNCPVGVLRYNCQDFTFDAVTLLRKYNITAYPMFGWYDHKAHNWVEVISGGVVYEIEPQTGQIVYPNGIYYMNGRRGVVRGLA